MPPAPKISADSVKIYMGGKSVKNKIQLDNSMLEDELAIQVPPGTMHVSLVIETKYRYASDFTVDVDGKNVAKVSVARILRHLPFEKGMTLTVVCSGKKIYKKIYQVQRSTAGIVPNSGRAKKSLMPLYQQIAGDLRAGKPLVITANVVLWDASFGGKKRVPMTDGNNPRQNLYWGAGYGMYHGFKNIFHWQLAAEEKDKMAVFKKVFTPNAFWQKMGVKKPFEVYVVFNLYRSKDIIEGYSDFAKNLFWDRPQRITLKDGKMIEAGSKSRIIGYVGHMATDGERAIREVRNSPGAKSNGAKGVFITSCLSAPIFSRSVLDENTYGLLFTTGLFAPEAYIQNALFEAVARGSGGAKIINSVASAYANYHDKYPSSLFVTSESTLIDSYSSPYDGDSDGDGIDNRIDPEPDKVNRFEKKGNSLIITTSNGRKVIVNLAEE